MFRLSVGQSGALSAETRGNTDTFGRLYTESGELLTSDDDSGQSLNFKIKRSVSARTYFLEVAGFSDTTTGPYQLVVSFLASGGGASSLVSNPAGLTGLFFDEATPGQGFNIIYGNAGITVFFYGHTAGGQRLWLISDTVSLSPRYSQAITLQMSEITAGQFGNPNPNSLMGWGTLRLTFLSCDQAQARLDGSDGNLQLSLTRLEAIGCN